MVETNPPAVVPYTNTLDENNPLWFLGVKTWIRSTSTDTGGGLGIVEQILPEGFASPYHVHHNEDESFYVIDGTVRFLCGEDRWTAGPGSFVCLPREIPHGFQVEGSDPVRMLLFVTPAGFEKFVEDLSEPTPPSGPPDLEQVIQVAARYDVEILGPLPD